jgi:hypothetical protein
MDKLEIIKSLKNTTSNAIDISYNSIAPTLGKADLLIVILLGFVVLTFYYFDVIKKK